MSSPPRSSRIGVEGFEPPTYCSQSSRASQAALYSDVLHYTHTPDFLSITYLFSV